MLRSSLLIVAIVVASAGHAQVSSDPQAAAPVVYSGTPLTVEDCNNPVGDTSSADGCVANREVLVDGRAAADYAPDYAPDYVPDYWEEAPIYGAAPNVYLGISLIPDGYWGWPYYGYGYGYGFGYGFGWPYYGYASFGFGWPYYGYAGYWGGGYWGGGSWHGHGHHGGGDHGDWGHHDGGHGHHGDYHGPYRYMGHGRYADQGDGSTGGHGGHASPPAAVATRTMTPANFTRSSMGPDNRSGLSGTPASAARTSAAATSQFSGANRFAGRAPLPSASYYAVARGAVGATRASYATTTPGGAAANYRGSAGTGYAYGRGNTVANGGSTNQPYRVTSMPSRGYAPSTRGYAASNNRGGAVARAGGVAPQNYGGSRAAYPQQRYAPSNRAYAHAATPAYSGARGAVPSYSGSRGPMPSYSGARGAAPSYSGGRGAMPSYSRGGSGSAAHGGGHTGPVAPHSGSSSASHSGSSRGH